MKEASRGFLFARASARKSSQCPETYRTSVGDLRPGGCVSQASLFISLSLGCRQELLARTSRGLSKRSEGPSEGRHLSSRCSSLFPFPQFAATMTPLRRLRPATPPPPVESLPGPASELPTPASFSDQLHISDRQLLEMDLSSYTAWLSTMFAGIARLADERAVLPKERDRLDKYRSEWRSLLQVKLHQRLQRLKKAGKLLVAKQNFQYLAEVLAPDSKDWYLVSGKSYQNREGKTTG